MQNWAVKLTAGSERTTVSWLEQLGVKANTLIVNNLNYLSV